MIEYPHMIQRITPNTDIKTMQKIVEIHKLCISQVNAKKYPPEVIAEWLSQVSIENTVNQFSTSSWITLEKDGNMVGFAQYSLNNDEIYQMQVVPTIQRSGYGRELYEYIEEDFRKNGKKQIELYSVLNAVEFYKALGFKKKKKIWFPLIKTKCEVIEMTKELK